MKSTQDKLKKLNKELYLKLAEFIQKENISIKSFSINYKNSEYEINEKNKDGIYMIATVTIPNNEYLDSILEEE